MLTTARDHYKENGYYIARNLLPISVLETVLHDMDIILIQQLIRMGDLDKHELTNKNILKHMQQLYAKDQSIYLQSIKLWAKLFSLQALIMHGEILTIIKSLGIDLPIFQTSPVVHVMSNNLKITGGYHGIGAHQDWPALQSGLDTITVWFPFMDVDKHNFPLDLIPGSHKKGLFPGTISEHIYEISPDCYKDEEFVSMELKFGDVLFMSNFTVHRSSLHGDHRLRIACSSRYENASEKTFIERIYPSAQKRVIQRELLHPGFPEISHIEAIFGS